MSDDIYFIFILDEGVFGIGYKTSYGYDSVYYLDGVGFQRQLEPDELTVLGLIEELSPGLIKYFDM